MLVMSKTVLPMLSNYRFITCTDIFQVKSCKNNLKNKADISGEQLGNWSMMNLYVSRKIKISIPKSVYPILSMDSNEVD